MPLLRVAVPAPLYTCFDYLPDPSWDIKQLAPGMRLRVPFGKREAIGVLIEVTDTAQTKIARLKTASAILDAEPLLTPTLMKLALFASQYYHEPIGGVFSSILPGLLRKGKSASWKKPPATNLGLGEQLPGYALNEAQQKAVQAVTAAINEFNCFLLNGVTGSGKTEVYLHIIDAIIKVNKQALILVPEIGLTPQILERFQQRFRLPIGVLHSAMTERERLDVWMHAKLGQIPIIIGTRSALFTPLLNPGVIIIDEEHDISFKQQEGFRYHARDLAIVRARMENIPIVLGSATPSLESLHNVATKRYQLLNLPARAGSAVQPHFHLIDIRNQTLENGLAMPLLKCMEKHLAQNGQILLFLNRRGFAPVWFCHACSWTASCDRCDVKLTYHQQPPSLLCHHCGATRVIPHKCPDCQSPHLYPLGLGTQRIEQTLAKHFPNIGIVRIDRDSTRRKGALHNMLETIHAGENRILIGTQMLAKGHHFPDVTLVAILDADTGLFSADFRATERVAQLLLQVAGRAGRAERAGEVYIQTYNPQHPLLLHLIEHGYMDFAKAALIERKNASLPPYTHVALFRAETVNAQAPIKFLEEVRDLAYSFNMQNVVILGPVPALIERRAGRYRAQLLLLANERNPVHLLLNKLLQQINQLPTIKRVRWALDVDPMEII
jgi:primosomal protein N' (replication factor Y)